MSDVATLALSPAGRVHRIVWPVLALWMLGIAFAGLWWLPRNPELSVIQLSALLCASLLMTAWMLQVGPRRARYLGVIVLAVVGVGVVLLFSQPPVRTRVLSLSMELAQGKATDRYVIIASVMLVMIVLTLLWFGLAVIDKEVEVPRGVLLLLPLVGLLVVLQAGAWRDLWPALALLAVGLVFGRWTLRHLVGEAELANPLSWIVAVCLGLGTIAIIWLGLGLVGQLRPIPIALTLLGLLAIAFRDARQLLTSGLRQVRQLGQPVRLRHNAMLLGLLSILVLLGLMQLIAALAPDLGFDSMLTHLAVAARFARQGGFEPTLESEGFYWLIPVQVLYGGLTALSGQVAAKVLHFLCGVLAGVGAAAFVFYLTRSWLSSALAAALFAASSLVWWLSGVGYVDLTITFYFLATICALIRWVETRQLGWLIATACCAGIAVPAKLTNAVLVPILALVIVACEWRTPRRLARSLVVAGIAGALVIAPWLAHTYLVSGNPVFPWFNQIFRSRFVEPVAVFAGVPFGIGTSVDALLRLPWVATFEPNKFVEVGELGVQFLAFSPLLIIVFVLGWPRVRIHPALLVVAAAAAIFMVVWAFGLLQNLRYLLPVLPLLAALLAVACHEAISRWGATLLAPLGIVVLCLAMIGSLLSVQSWWLGGISGSGLPYRLALGRQTRENYLATYLPSYRALRFLNDKYQGQAQILAFQPNGRLYSDAPIYYQHDIHTPLPMREALRQVEKQTDPAAVYQTLRNLGFTHLFFNRRAATEVANSDPLIYERRDFLDHFAKVEYTDTATVLYKLIPEDAAAQIQPPDEMLLNGGFETGRGNSLADWQAYGKPRWDRSGQMAHTGNAAIGVEGQNQYLSSFQPVVAGHTYLLRAYAMSPDADTTVSFQVLFASEQDQVVAWPAETFKASSTYQAYQMYATAPPEARSARVIFLGAAPQKWVWLDDASLVDVSP